MKPLHLAALVIGAAATAFFVVAIAVGLFDNPGGVRGVVVLLVWLAIPFVLGVFAAYSPRAAYPVLVVIVGLALIYALTSILAARAVWAFEEANGPVNLMISIAVLAPLVVLGKSLPHKAGVLIILTVVGMFVLQSISLLFVGKSSLILELAVTVPPYLISGGLFWLAGRRAETPATNGG